MTGAACCPDDRVLPRDPGGDELEAVVRTGVLLSAGREPRRGERGGRLPWVRGDAALGVAKDDARRER